CFLSMLRLPHITPLFPYTTLFRSHTSEHCRPRADANPHRSARSPVGRGLADLRRDLVLYQPHALAGSTRELVAASPRAHVAETLDRKSTRLNSSHVSISYAVFCLK